MQKITTHDRRKAEEMVDGFNVGDKLGHNVKYLEDNETIQIRIGDTLRVQFKITDGRKEIIDLFHKGNHIDSSVLGRR